MLLLLWSFQPLLCLPLELTMSCVIFWSQHVPTQRTSSFPRANKPGLRVLNSYWVAQDGWHEVPGTNRCGWELMLQTHDIHEAYKKKHINNYRRSPCKADLKSFKLLLLITMAVACTLASLQIGGWCAFVEGHASILSGVDLRELIRGRKTDADRAPNQWLWIGTSWCHGTSFFPNSTNLLDFQAFRFSLSQTPMDFPFHGWWSS